MKNNLPFVEDLLLKENTKNLLIITGIFLTLLLVVLIVGIKFSMKELPAETIGNTEL